MRELSVGALCACLSSHTQEIYLFEIDPLFQAGYFKADEAINKFTSLFNTAVKYSKILYNWFNKRSYYYFSNSTKYIVLGTDLGACTYVISFYS